MQMKNIYVIWDACAQIYNTPFYLLNDQVALRAAKDMLKQTNNQIAENPQDFIMFRCGTYNDETAEFKGTEILEVVCKFHELDLESVESPLPDLKEA